MELMFEIKKQRIKRIDNNKVVADSRKYLYAIFNFSSDWDGLKKIALFRHERNDDIYEEHLENDSCYVPWEVIQQSRFSVSVFAHLEDKLITTNILYVKVSESGYNATISLGDN